MGNYKRMAKRKKNCIANKIKFDLQLFGGGGGKSTGKLIGSIAFGFLTGGTGFFGAGVAGSTFGAHFANFMLGASLFSNIWSATHQSTFDSNLDITRFDRNAETMSSDGQIPIVYGERYISGNQTFHETNAEANTLHKHVVLCEGGIEGIESVCANELLIPTGNQTSNTVFTIQNIKYHDAIVSISNKRLYLTANNTTEEIYMCNKDDTNGSFYDWQISISALVSHINRIGDGWQAFPVATTSKYPGDIHNISGNCYKNPVNMTVDTVVGGTKYTFHDCEAPSNYVDVGGYPKLAWLDMTFSVSSELSGNPSVTCTIKGKKIFDTRTNKTEYSTNPAMCLRDFILSKRYGLGKWFSENDLDIDSWNESADYCDELILVKDSTSDTMVNIKRYELNMVIDQRRTALEWVQEILANFCGYLVFDKGKLKLNIEKPTSSSYSFDDSSCFDLSVSPLALSETPNRYTVSIVDPLNNWSTVKCYCEDYADQKQRQRIITKDVSLEGCTSQHQALRLARFYRDFNLTCPLQISFTTGLQAMHLQCGDVVTVSWHGVFNNLPIRISTIKETNKGTFEISGRQYNDTIYTDDLGGGVHWYNYTIANNIDVGDLIDSGDIIPSVPVGLTLSREYREYANGSTGYDVIANCSTTTNAEVICYEYRTDAIPAENVGVFLEGIPADKIGYSYEWTSAGESNKGVTISNAKIGDTYIFRAKSRSTTGNYSKYSDEVSIKILPKTTVPSQPYNLTYDFTNAFHFSWSDVPDSDFVYYELRLDEKVGNKENLLGRTTSTSINVTLTSRVGNVFLYAVNAQKIASEPAKTHYYQPKLDAPSSISYTARATSVDLIVPPFPLNCKSVNFYISGNKFSDTVVSKNASYNLSADADIYTIVASYNDLFGEGFRSAEYNIPIEPYFNPDWIKDGSLAMEKVDAVVKDALDKGLYTYDQIVRVVKDADSVAQGKDNYSAITQLADAINFRVSGDELISQINIAPQGTTIDGKYLHVTGATKFDKDVIVEGMIKTGAITADKIASNSITADKIASKSITSDKIASNSITADKIASKSITSEQLAVGSITADKIKANSITATNLSDELIDSLQADAQIQYVYSNGKYTLLSSGVIMLRYSSTSRSITVHPKLTRNGVTINISQNMLNYGFSGYHSSFANDAEWTYEFIFLLTFYARKGDIISF